MRLVVFALVLSLLFSGYSAAAHAFDPMPCHSSGIEKKADMDDMADCQDCPDHKGQMDKADSGDGNKDGDTAKHKCIACTHCCASHAMTIPDYSFNMPLQTAVLNPLPVSGYVDGYLFSLLRPPKSLV
jgi:hypothetical protein